MPDHEPRVLVLGSAPHSRLVTAHKWDALPECLNVADYNKVVLNFVPLEDQELARSIDATRLPRQQQFTKLLFSGGEVVAIGRPDVNLGNASAFWWLPWFPPPSYDGGTVINLQDDSFSFFFDQVKAWSFSVEPYAGGRIPGDHGWCRAIHPALSFVEATVDPIRQRSRIIRRST